MECADTDYDNKFGSNSTHVSLADWAISSCIIYIHIVIFFIPGCDLLEY